MGLLLIFLFSVQAAEFCSTVVAQSAIFEQAKLQGRIERSDFRTDRNLSQYIQDFGPRLGLLIQGLKTQDVLIDFGAGQGEMAREYLTRSSDRWKRDKSGRWIEEAVLPGMNTRLPPIEQRARLLTLGFEKIDWEGFSDLQKNRVIDHSGHNFDSISNQQIIASMGRKAKLGVDDMGILSYSGVSPEAPQVPKLREHLTRSLELMSENDGVLMIRSNPAAFDFRTPGQPFSHASWAQNLNLFFRSITGVQVVRIDWVNSALVIELKRLVGPVRVPPIRMLELKNGRPVTRVMELL